MLFLRAKGRLWKLLFFPNASPGLEFPDSMENALPRTPVLSMLPNAASTALAVPDLEAPLAVMPKPAPPAPFAAPIAPPFNPVIVLTEPIGPDPWYAEENFI